MNTYRAWFHSSLMAPALLLSGCGRGGQDVAAQSLLERAAVRVAPAALDAFVGVYRLPSGALWRVTRDGDRLLAGTPAYELLPQTTRHFTSNRVPGGFHFEKGTDSRMRLKYVVGKREFWSDRMEPDAAVDPARLVDVGEHRLRLLVAGEGSPVIVLEDGFGTGIEKQSFLQADLSRLTTVVSYDHASTGGSDESSKPRDGVTIAAELRRALAAAGLQPPFVLVGSSIGGDYVRIFAHQFPHDTAGLALLDPTPDFDELLEWVSEHSPRRAALFRRIFESGERAIQAIMAEQEPGRRREWSALPDTRRQAREAVLPDDVAIVQISGATGEQTSGIMHDKIQFFDSWLGRRLPQARHVRAPHSGHAVAITDSALVGREVESLVLLIRAKIGLSNAAATRDGSVEGR